MCTHPDILKRERNGVPFDKACEICGDDCDDKLCDKCYEAIREDICEAKREERILQDD